MDNNHEQFLYSWTNSKITPHTKPSYSIAKPGTSLAETNIYLLDELIKLELSLRNKVSSDSHLTPIGIPFRYVTPLSRNLTTPISH